ncbi:hypothetical protein PIB30_025371 [Stylosanthes scabra]|uniref:Uncharacterized protein n=1 Tax=Stylosanthes scabra TaxID=79078 RepID=A0ABU6Z7N1_9FABA|nr:hypothetical protein [Stylosanthes scabra]
MRMTCIFSQNAHPHQKDRIALHLATTIGEMPLPFPTTILPEPWANWALEKPAPISPRPGHTSSSMATEDIHAIVYPNEKISQSFEGVMFSCEDPVWVLISTQTCLQELKSLILMNLDEVKRKEVTRILYRMPVAMANSFVYRKMPLRTNQNVSMMFSYHCGIASVFAIEFYVQIQDVGGSSSSSNHVESGRGTSISYDQHKHDNEEREEVDKEYMDEDETNVKPMIDDHGFDKGYSIDSLEDIGMIEF